MSSSTDLSNRNRSGKCNSPTFPCYACHVASHHTYEDVTFRKTHIFYQQTEVGVKKKKTNRVRFGHFAVFIDLICGETFRWKMFYFGSFTTQPPTFFFLRCVRYDHPLDGLVRLKRKPFASAWYFCAPKKKSDTIISSTIVK